MEIERWLNLGLYGTQNVIDLATNFELLPAIVPEEPGEGAIFTLVMESQVCVPSLCSLICALIDFPGSKLCERAPHPQPLVEELVSVDTNSMGRKLVDIEVE